MVMAILALLIVVALRTLFGYVMHHTGQQKPRLPNLRKPPPRT